MLYKDELLFIVKNWTRAQVDNYIQQLEARVMVEKELISELKQTRKKMKKKEPVDTGNRGAN